MTHSASAHSAPALDPTSYPSAADLDDIQGIVYSGWNDHIYSGFLFATLGDDQAASRRWLGALAGEITPAARHRRIHPGRLQLAISPTGLAALGVPDDVIGMLPAEAQAGMASRVRSLDDSEPATWQLGGPGDRLDVIVMIYACEPHSLAKRLTHQRAALEAAGATVYPDELGHPLDQREHFGFTDGLSQPYLPGLNAEPRRGQDRIAAGEILLGYPNAYDRYPISPLWGNFDLGRNGSYLVFRKLAQDVAGFWGWIANHARQLAGGDTAFEAELTQLLAAKVVGRWPNGAPLALTPDHDDPEYATPDRVNAFKYLAHDPDGFRCPVSAHIRRANPRDARGGSADESELIVSRHRILRRGRSYGPPLPYADAIAGRGDGQSRGLYFLCLQSSIARGFEFIQQSWLANPGFGGLHNEPDPIIGNRGGTCSMTIPALPTRLRLAGVPTVVTNRGGGYFFLPSLAAIAYIANPPPNVEAGSPR